MQLNKSQKMFFEIIIGGFVVILIVLFAFNRGQIAKNRDVTLTIWGVTDAQSDLQNAFTEFESYIKTIPEYSRTDVTFSYRLWREDEYENLLINQLAEGEGPDIFFIHNSWLPKHHDKLVPAPTNIISVDEFKNTFVPVATDDLIYNNQVYSLPLYVDTLALYYNTNHFRMADFSSVKPAFTWNKLQDQVAKLTIHDSSPTGLKRAGIAIGSSHNVTQSTDILYLMMLQNGVSMCNDDCTEATFNENLMDSDDSSNKTKAGPAEQSLQLFSSFSNKEFAYYSWHPEYLTDLDLTYNRNEIDAFVEGNVSMIFGYSDIYSEIDRRSERSNVVFDVAPVPQLLDPEETGINISYANYWSPAVSRFSTDGDIAWQFIRFASTKDQLNKYYNTTNRPTSRLDLIDFQKAVPRLQIWAGQAKDAKSLDLFDYGQFEIIFGELIDRVVTREFSIEDAMIIAVEKVNNILNIYSSL